MKTTVCFLWEINFEIIIINLKKNVNPNDRNVQIWEKKREKIDCASQQGERKHDQTYAV